MSETRLTEADKLLNKINIIYTNIGGKNENGKRYILIFNRC
jgi:hypothetical protein